MEVDHQRHAGLVRRRHDRLGILDRGREGLLDQDVLAGLGAGDGNGAVGMVGRRHRHRLDRRVGQDVVETGGVAARAVGLGEALGAGLVEVAHGREVDQRVAAVGLGVALAKEAGADRAQNLWSRSWSFESSGVVEGLNGRGLALRPPRPLAGR